MPLSILSEAIKKNDFRRTLRTAHIGAMCHASLRWDKRRMDEAHQAVPISHHPELLGTAGEEYGRYLWRDNRSSPTRYGPLKVPSGLTTGEAIARGWIDG